MSQTWRRQFSGWSLWFTAWNTLLKYFVGKRLDLSSSRNRWNLYHRSPLISLDLSS